MEWRQADVFQLIEEYKNRRLLWDATVDDFKIRNKRHDAWAELDNKFVVSAGESEKKMRKLLSQFTRECKKAYKSGRGAEENIKWVYFKSLMFLKDKNKPRTSMDGGLNEEENDETSVTEESQVDEINQEQEDCDDGPLSSPLNNPPESVHSPVTLSRATSQCGALPATSMTPPASARARAPKRKANAMAEEAYTVMKGLATNRNNRDDLDAFGESIAMSLRKMSKISCAHAKYEINKILFNAELGVYEQPASRPMSSATTSSGYSNVSSIYSAPISPVIQQQPSAAVGSPLTVNLPQHTETNVNLSQHIDYSETDSPSVLNDDTTQFSSIFAHLN